jgi:hypothetical protein
MQFYESSRPRHLLLSHIHTTVPSTPHLPPLACTSPPLSLHIEKTERTDYSSSYGLFGWLVADDWCWFVVREKYCWLVADKRSE